MKERFGAIWIITTWTKGGCVSHIELEGWIDDRSGVY
jgi:hypothetical protein